MTDTKTSLLNEFDHLITRMQTGIKRSTSSGNMTKTQKMKEVQSHLAKLDREAVGLKRKLRR